NPSDSPSSILSTTLHDDQSPSIEKRPHPPTAPKSLPSSLLREGLAPSDILHLCIPPAASCPPHAIPSHAGIPTGGHSTSRTFPLTCCPSAMRSHPQA